MIHQILNMIPWIEYRLYWSTFQLQYYHEVWNDSYNNNYHNDDKTYMYCISLRCGWKLIDDRQMFKHVTSVVVFINNIGKWLRAFPSAPSKRRVRILLSTRKQYVWKSLPLTTLSAPRAYQVRVCYFRFSLCLLMVRLHY